MSPRNAMIHPLALALLVASLIGAAALAFLPPLAALANRAPWVLLWGLVSYGLITGLSTWRSVGPAPAMRQLMAIRRTMVERLAARQAAEASRGYSTVTCVIEDAIRHLDEEALPTLEQVIRRNDVLRRQLNQYEREELPLPDAAVLRRLRAIEARQREAIGACVQQAVNADATLLALTQEGDEASVAEQARRWSADLLKLHDSLAEVLRGSNDWWAQLATHEARRLTSAEQAQRKVRTK